MSDWLGSGISFPTYDNLYYSDPSWLGSGVTLPEGNYDWLGLGDLFESATGLFDPESTWADGFGTGINLDDIDTTWLSEQLPSYWDSADPAVWANAPDANTRWLTNLLGGISKMGSSVLGGAAGAGGTIGNLLAGEVGGDSKLWGAALGGLLAYQQMQAAERQNAALRAAASRRSPEFTKGLDDLRSAAGLGAASFAPPQARGNVMKTFAAPTSLRQPMATGLPTVSATQAQGNPFNPVKMAGGGHYYAGGTKGQDDLVPALLSDGEYVMDAETVSMLGDGNNAAGAEMLDAMRENLRQHKRGAAANQIAPKAKRPEHYLKD